MKEINDHVHEVETVVETVKRQDGALSRCANGDASYGTMERTLSLPRVERNLPIICQAKLMHDFG